MSPPRVLMSWSSGKDSALAFQEARRDGGLEVVALLTTVTETYDRVSMHGVRRTLVEAQARLLGLPLEVVTITAGASNDSYDAAMAAMLARQRDQGVTGVVFGDIFLEDVRRYREERLARVGMHAHFPLWGRDTTALVHTLIGSGFRVRITCVDCQRLDVRLSGRTLDERFLAELPDGVDPCGEHGEYHTFVFAGPIFPHAIGHTVGETVLRDGRYGFCDLLPSLRAAPPAERWHPATRVG